MVLAPLELATEHDGISVRGRGAASDTRALTTEERTTVVVVVAAPNDERPGDVHGLRRHRVRPKNARNLAARARTAPGAVPIEPAAAPFWLSYRAGARRGRWGARLPTMAM